MARPEGAIKGSDNALTAFAADLRKMREWAGRPGYRILAKHAHVSASRLSDAANGRSLPTLAVTLAYVRACGGDDVAWEQRWHALAADRAATTSASTSVVSAAPYVGLAAFGPHDAGLFFGRESLVDELVERVRNQRFVAVFGASGAGKSSVLRAGLIARMRDEARCVLFTPGAHPVEECAIALTELMDQPVSLADVTDLHFLTRQAGDLVLVVDQFEEIFTLCQHDTERADFIAMLLHATRHPDSHVRVVLGVRTDFYTHCARDAELVTALRDAQVLVGPMSPEQIRLAVTGPAAQSGIIIEKALLAAVAADCAGQAGVLPLLSHALLETWQRRSGTTLTLSGYQAAGGIAHAVARTAELTYVGFDDERQRLAKALFLRLVAPIEGTEDTKRRIDRSELDTPGGQLDSVLTQLTQARLISLDHDHIDITHEAVIRHWPRLRDWLAENRDGLRLHRRLTDAVGVWESLDHDDDALYRGTRLASANDWLEGTDLVLTEREHAFLSASRAAEARDRTLTQRRTRRLRQAVALLTVLLVAAGALAVEALRAERSAAAQRELATTQRDLADAQRVLAQATVLRSTDPALATQLVLAAHTLAPTQQTDSGVLNSLGAPHVAPMATPGIRTAISRDGHVAAVVTNTGAVQLWVLSETNDKAKLVSTIDTRGEPTSLVLGPNRRALFAGTGEWDITNPAHPVLRGRLPASATLAFAAGDRQLVLTARPRPRLWDVTDPHRPSLTATLPPTDPGTWLVSPDGRTLADVVGGRVGRVQFWDINDPGQPKAAATTRLVLMRSADVTAYGGTTLALASADGTIKLWDTADAYHPRHVTTLPSQGVVTNMAFSADGSALATAQAHGPVTVWNLSTPANPAKTTTLTGHVGGIYAMAFGSVGRTLVTVGADNTVQWDDLPAFPLTSGPNQVTRTPAFTPDGHVLATTGSTAANGPVVDLWDLTDATPPRLATTVTADVTNAIAAKGIGAAVVFSPRGHLMATGDYATTRLWDVSDIRHSRALGTLPGNAGPVQFSPDGRMLLQRDGRLWSVADTRHPRLIGPTTRPNGWYSVAFSPDGHTIGVCTPRSVTLWDVATSGQLRRTGQVPVAAATTLTFAGHLLATGTFNGHVQVWNVTDPGKPVLRTMVPGNHGSDHPVVFSPDGNTLAVGSAGQTTRLWNLADPGKPELRAALDDAVTPVAFGPDGHTLAVFDTNGSLQLRDTDVRHAINRMCSLAAPLSQAQWDQYFPGETYQPSC
jgi:WD40 repeat protein